MHPTNQLEDMKTILQPFLSKSLIPWLLCSLLILSPGIELKTRGQNPVTSPDTLQFYAKLCYNHLKKHTHPRESTFEEYTPGEADFVAAARNFYPTRQREDLALANLCAHLMHGNIGTVEVNPSVKADPELPRLVRYSVTHSDPLVRILMLLALAADPSPESRAAMIQASFDPHPGVRKGVCYLIEQVTGQYFGPIGNIHIGSSTGEVDQACQSIRECYKKDPRMRQK